MFRIIIVSFFLAFMAATAGADTKNSPEKITSLVVSQLLVNGDQSERKLAAKIIHHEKVGDVAALDLVAMRLYHMEVGSDSDLAAWYIKSLSVARDGRYVAFLEGLKNTYAGNSKVRSHVDKTLKLSSKFSSDVDRFSPDSKNIDSMVESAATMFSQELNKRDRKNPAYTFENLGSGASLQKVFQTIGVPDTTVAEVNSKHQPFVGRISFQVITLTYKDLGSITLTEDKGVYVIDRISKAIVMDSGFDDEGLVEYADLLINGTTQQYRAVAKTIYRSNITDEELMDVIAARIWADKDTRDKYGVDGVAWLLKCLGNSRNPRYHSFVKDVSASTSVNKIRKYAKKTLEALPHSNVEQFQL